MAGNSRLLVEAVQMREMDRITIEEDGVPGLHLMEAAGTGTACAMQKLPQPLNRVAILCGPGNNGGDGFVVARHLRRAGLSVGVVLTISPDKLRGDAKTNFDRLPNGIDITRADQQETSPALAVIAGADTLVDGLLGTGLQRDVTGLYAELIRACNTAQALRIALDIPSGLSSDTGQILGTAFRAHHTYTYGLRKIGQVIHPGTELCGELHRIDIGIRAETVERVGAAGEWLTQSRARQSLSPRVNDTHKGTYGHLLLVAGAPGKGGAAVLAAHGALRSGVGLITCVTDPATRLAMLSQHPEAMSAVLDAETMNGKTEQLLEITKGKTALAIGPGWGLGDEQTEILQHLLDARPDLPMLLDADALTLVAQLGLKALKTRAKAGGVTILTPHPGEAARLLNCETADVQANRPAAARKLAKETDAHVVLKGARSLIKSPAGFLYVCPFGNPGMATGGMGDVLTGLLGGLLAMRLNTTEALLCGVSSHGLAGDLAATQYGQHGLTAGDAAVAIGNVWQAWEQNLDVVV